MTGRERLINVLEGKKVDRIPNAPFIFYNFIDEFYSREEIRSLDAGTGGIDYVEKGIEVYEHFGFDILLRTANTFEYLTEVSDEEGKWVVERKQEGDKDNYTVHTTITTPEKTLTQTEQYSRTAPHEIVQAITEYFIKDVSDFDQFVKYQPPLRKMDTAQITKARKLLADRGLVAPWAQGVFNSVSFYRDVGDLIMDPYTDEGFYKSMMGYFPERMFNLIKQQAEAGADMICAGGNVANGKMAGPNFFKEFVLDYEIDFTKRVKDLGVYYLYHNCGDAKSLYQLYSPIKMNIFETLTKSPAADNDLKLAFETFDRDIILSGNIDQIDFLLHATPREVKAEVKKVLDLAKHYGNFILAASDYFSEGTPYDNIKAFAEAGLEYGVY